MINVVVLRSTVVHGHKDKKRRKKRQNENFSSQAIFRSDMDKIKSCGTDDAD